ncbi:MAG TPA: hypothetical protein VE978_00825 [Chitinophagales bacterium]|nr:hypothetical protein [Chitinophagales bacterium]
MNNKIGKRGESIFSTIVSRYIQSKGFLLDPIFLGEKFSAVDFYVDLLSFTGKRGFFFASVKATTQGLNSGGTKIKIPIKKKLIKQLNKFTVPVYLFGIDEKMETGYFISANGIDGSKYLNGIPTKYPVTEQNITMLWKEVKDYWMRNQEITNFDSRFK